jgi:hypothetical protein
MFEIIELLVNYQGRAMSESGDVTHGNAGIHAGVFCDSDNYYYKVMINELVNVGNALFRELLDKQKYVVVVYCVLRDCRASLSLVKNGMML